MAKCAICKSPNAKPSAWCRTCSRAYDRHTAKDDGTLISIVDWAARRAWLAARAEIRLLKVAHSLKVRRLERQLKEEKNNVEYMRVELGRRP